MLAVEICGQMYVSMSEVRSRIYPGVSSSALRSFMSRRGIRTVLAKGDIRSMFESQLGQITGRGGHYLMSAANLNVMLLKRESTRATEPIPEKGEKAEEEAPHFADDNFKDDNDNDILRVEDLMTYCGHPLRFSVGEGDIRIDLGSFVPIEGTADASSKDSPKPLHDALANSCEQTSESNAEYQTEDETPSVEPTEATCANKMEQTAIPMVSDKERTSEKSASPKGSSTEIIDQNVQKSDQLSAVTKKSPARGRPVCLAGDLEQQLKDLVKFYTKVINPFRPTSSISESTMHRHERRIRLFLDFASKERKQKPTFDDSLDIDLTSKYVDHLSEALGSGTVANHVQSIIILAKYVLRGLKKRDRCTDDTEIAHLRHMQAQLQVHSPQCTYICIYQVHQKKVYTFEKS